MAGFHNGRGFYDPMKFTAAAIEWEKTHAEAPLATAEDAPVEAMPAHSVEKPEPVVTPAVTTEAPKPAPVASKPAINEALKLGSKGAAVKHLQEFLGITADGDFGPNTKAVVMKFQTSKGLTADGIVGPKTWALVK
jgi:murein L,D-transpeptidase YcbB/YkuD